MSILILMRHAKAVREHEAADDRARDLTPAGLRDAAAAAVSMDEAGFAPARILVSPASRTRMSAHAVRRVLSSVTETVVVDSLYLCAPEMIWTEARANFTEAGMMVVGHNPGLHHLIADWIERSRDRSALARGLQEGLATSGWAAFEVTDEPLRALAPKLIGGAAGRGGG